MSDILRWKYFDLDMDSILSVLGSASSSGGIFDCCPSSSNFTQFVHDSQSFLLLLSHIEEIGWSSMRLSSSDSSTLVLHHTYIDLADRAHELNIEISARWPVEHPRCHANLPVEFIVESWCPKTSRLKEILDNFHALVDSLQPFWTQMIELERDGIVLDEKPIPYASTTRRIKLTDNVHIQLQVSLTDETVIASSSVFDPFNSSAFPSITFHGPPMLVRSFDDCLEANRAQWNEGHSNIILNLEHMLDMTLPTKFFFKSTTNQSNDDQQQECGICYESTMDIDAPVIYCETANCFKRYHEKCWRSWLRKKVPQRGGCDVLDIVVDERAAMTTMSGPCLFCKRLIVVN